MLRLQIGDDEPCDCRAVNVREVGRAWKDAVSSYDNCLGGALWTSSAAYQRFFVEMCDLSLPGAYTSSSECLAQLVKSCGLVCAHDRFAIMTERPVSVSIQNGRLHNERSAAVWFRDGFRVHALQGVVVPRDWIAQKDAVD